MANWVTQNSRTSFCNNSGDQNRNQRQNGHQGLTYLFPYRRLLPPPVSGDCTASWTSDYITPISASTLYPHYILMYQTPSASPLKDMCILWGPRIINPPISVCLLSSFLWMTHILRIFTYWKICKCCVFRVSPSRKCVGNLISNAVILGYGIRCLGHGGDDVRLFLTADLKSLQSSERRSLGWGIAGLDWALGMSVKDCLDWYGRAQSTVGGTIPRQVDVGCIRKVNKSQRLSQQTVFLHGFCFKFLLEFLHGLPSIMDYDPWS